MTKTLTEQWRDGTLPRGAYYVNRLNEIRIYLVTYEDDKNTHEIYEVLAPVPSYDKHKRLKKKLEIALSVLGQIAMFSSDKADAVQCAKAIKDMSEVVK